MEIDKQIGGWLNGFQPALLIIAANRLGIFDRLAGKPVTAKQVADGLKLSLKGSERLLNALAGLGIVTKEKDQFHMPGLAKIPHQSRGPLHAAVDRADVRPYSGLDPIAGFHPIGEPDHQYHGNAGKRPGKDARFHQCHAR